jgi:hypothetical protein
MSPRHFANYAKNDPQQYQSFSDNMWNGFVTVTHKIGLSPFFSFTPEFLEGLNAKQIGKQLGKVYNQAMTDNPVTGSFADGEIPGDQDQTTQQQTPIE